MRLQWGIDHAGYTVPDLDEAVAFFCEAFSCELVCEAGPYEGAGYVWPGDATPEETTLRLAFLRHGEHNIELLEYRSAEPPGQPPRPSSVGSGHLALYVTDIEAAVEELRCRAGVRVLGSPIREHEGPLAGLAWVYVMLPWGMVIELVERPPQLPYEASTAARLANPTLVTRRDSA